MESDWIFL